MQYFMLNKPAGCLSVRSDPQGRTTVYKHVPRHYPALAHVGRLDYNTEGLLLFTDDGTLANALLQGGRDPECPEAPHLVEKVYHVKVRGHLAPDDPRLVELEQPLVYPDGIVTRPARVGFVELRSSATWISVTLSEGRHRQVRLLCQRSDFLVVKLRRVQLGPLLLGDLPLRWCRPLTEAEVAACYALALPGVERPPVEPIDDSPEARRRVGERGAPGDLPAPFVAEEE